MIVLETSFGVQVKEGGVLIGGNRPGPVGRGMKWE